MFPLILLFLFAMIVCGKGGDIGCIVLMLFLGLWITLASFNWLLVSICGG